MNRSRLDHRSRGFTLLEVLIVVSIVAVLAAFLTVAIGRSITQAKEAATRTTLLKLDGLLQQRLDAFRVLMDTPQKQNELKSKITARRTVLEQSAPAALQRVMNEKLVSLMVYKDYYRQGFPQTLADNSFLGNSGQPFAGNAQNAAESSEMLHWLITQADTYGVPAVDDSEFTSSEVADTDGDGRMEFVDAWGLPLRFYRWPTRLLRPAGPAIPPLPLGTDITWLNIPPVGRNLAGILMKGLPAAASLTGDADPLALDPDDRLGAVLAALTRNTNISTADVTTILSWYESNYHTPDTYHIPLIVSGGPDKTAGLNEPYNTANYGYLAAAPAATISDPFNSNLNDNLTNRQKQQK
jgi:prepilin-type N-terminal cleavage/methylation domain-containing protein